MWVINRHIYSYSFVILFFFLLTNQSHALPGKMAVEIGGQQSNQPAEWDAYKLKYKGVVWFQYLAKTSLAVDLGKDAKSLSPYCQYKEGRLTVYSNVEKSQCDLILESGDKTTVEVSMTFDHFDLFFDKKCGDYAIRFDYDKSKVNKEKKGFLALLCRRKGHELFLSVDHSEDYQIIGSQKHEFLGKNKNFKVYRFTGFGKLSNNEDLLLNEFSLKDSSGEEAVPFSIYRKSYLLIRQSPFEVDLGAALNQVSLNGNDGSESQIAVRGLMSLGYLFWGSYLARLDGEADIFSLGDSEQGGSGTSYFFYETQMLFGYRFHFSEKSEMDVLGGLSFAKYSFQLGVSRRLYSRRGFMAKVMYKRLNKERTDFYIGAQMQNYESGNSSVGVRLGYRPWESKITPMLGFSQASLSDLSPLNPRSDTVQSLMLGASLDF